MTLFALNIESTDEYFSLLRDDSRFQDERHFVENLWVSYEPYADPNFVSELAKQFHPRFWEMYLTCTLLELEFDVFPKEQPDGPDICIRNDEKFIWIEAISPERGQGNDAVPQRKIGVASKVPEDQIILRYTSAIKEKFEKYLKYRREEVLSVEAPYVIAISGGNIPYAFLDDHIPRIIKAVLPIGPYEITIDWETVKAVNEGYSYRPTVSKKSGSDVSTNTFLDEAYNGISGLLYSNINVFNRPRELGRDIIFFHNPIAKNPVLPGWLNVGREYWLEGDKIRCKKW